MAALPQAELDQLFSSLQPVSLAQRQVLHDVGARSQGAPLPTTPADVEMNASSQLPRRRNARGRALASASGHLLRLHLLGAFRLVGQPVEVDRE